MPVRCVVVRCGNTGDSKKGVQASKKVPFFSSWSYVSWACQSCDQRNRVCQRTMIALKSQNVPAEVRAVMCKFVRHRHLSLDFKWIVRRSRNKKASITDDMNNRTQINWVSHCKKNSIYLRHRSRVLYF